jgi:hypothetical protein
MGLSLSISTTVSGPAFDGRDAAAIEAACREIERKTATFGAAIIRAKMDRTFQVQTPYYRLMNVATQSGPSGWKIHDQGVIYGPWLEGVGSRNRTTRFKGYAIYRKSVAEIQRHMDNIAEIEIEDALRRAGEDVS